MAKKRKSKSKTKIVYRNIKPKEPSINTSKIKSELTELESKKEKVRQEIEKDKKGKKGFSKFAVGLGGVFRKGAINKQITEKRRILGTQSSIERARGQTSLLKQRVELEKARAELREVQGKNKVDFNSLGVGSVQQNKQIKIEDIFK